MTGPLARGGRAARLAATGPPGAVPNPITSPSFTGVHRRGRRRIDVDEVTGRVHVRIADAAAELPQRTGR